jgi:hypothetical protein
VGYGIPVYGAICYMVHCYLHCWLAYQGVVFMNERIRELMEEAGIYDFVVESMGINEEMEKFTELIVRKCASIAFDAYAATDGADSGESAILKHFGVEE